MNDFLTLLLVFVELNVQNLPVTYTDTGMAALMALVAIVTTKVLHLTLMVDSDFINITPYLSHHIWSRVRTKIWRFREKTLSLHHQFCLTLNFQL